MDPYLYSSIFLFLAVLLSMVEATKYSGDKLQLSNRPREPEKLLVLALLLILWLGLRPVSWAFGDTGNYAQIYLSATNAAGAEPDGDLLFYGIMNSMIEGGFNVRIWFLVIEIFYIGCTAYSVYKLFPYRTMTAFAVVLASFSFYAYGVNGIRQGMACALFLSAITLVKERRWILVALFCAMAASTHSSVLLPIGALVLSYFYKNTKVYAYIWVLCIVLALVGSDFFETLFASKGIMITGHDSSYLTNDNVDMSQFSNTGFRYDFLLYSSVPVIFGYYFVVKKRFDDNWYKILLNTYIICNSFWVLINESWLSNRIAYLSWSMYAFVLMYPLLTNPYVKKRRLKINYVVIGNAAFSTLMWILGKYN